MLIPTINKFTKRTDLILIIIILLLQVVLLYFHNYSYQKLSKQINKNN